MTSDFVPELAKYPKGSPKSAKIAQNGDLENDVRYARNFVALIGNRGRRATSDFAPELAIRPNTPKGAANPKIVQNSV